MNARSVKLDMAEVTRMYVEDGLPGHAIGAAMGCCASHILRMLATHGVKPRHHNDSKRGKPSKNRIDLDPSEVVRLYALDGWSAKAVGDHMGVSRSVIDRILRENGTPKKPISEAREFRGDGHPMWRHDLTPEERDKRRDMVKQKAWREAVYLRDGYTCQCCLDASGGNLNAHHIIPHSKDRSVAWDVSNGITFCAPCHRAFHRKYKYKHCNAANVADFIADYAKVNG